MTFRTPLTPPPASVPLAARSVGYRNLPTPFAEEMASRPLVGLFWGVSGQGSLLRVNTWPVAVEPGWVAWFDWQETHVLQSQGPWEYWWWMIDGSLAPHLLREIGWKTPGRHYAGLPPTALFEQLASHLSHPGGQTQAASLAYRLLLIAQQDGIPNASMVCQQCEELIQQHGANPDCSVAWLAEKLGIHRATLNRHCQATWQCSAGAALRAWRVQRGLELLQDSAFSQASIATVATSAGYHDPAYFSREIKAHTGHAPQWWRRVTQ